MPIPSGASARPAPPTAVNGSIWSGLQAPAAVHEIELDEAVAASTPAEQGPWGGPGIDSALFLVRLHTHPLGVVRLDDPSGPDAAERLDAEVARSLSAVV